MERLCLLMVLFAALTSARAQVAPVTGGECAAWLDHLIPLPHEIAIAQKAVVRPQDVGIKLRVGAGDVEQQALSELLALFKEKAGVEPKGRGFEIHMGALDEQGQLNGFAAADGARLKTLPHSDQAYLIQPVGEAKLLVAALSEKGAYYGVQTLIQLLSPKLAKEQVEVPLATVLDWPDLDERGLWNFDLGLIPWITSLKLNFAKVPALPKRIERGTPVRAKLASNVLVAGRVRALKAVPNVTHFNYIGAKHGGYEAYPEMAGKGDEAVPTIWYKPRRIRVPCADCPALKKIIAEYMMELASKGAVEISVWLSEFWGQCQCKACLEAGQLRMETRAAVEGWLEARKQYPDLVLRIFYCMGGKSSEDTYNVLKELPPEVKIERCYGKYGDAFDKAAAEGRWLASYAGPPMAKAEFSGLRFHGAKRTRDYVRRLLSQQWDGMYSINYVYSTGAYQQALWRFHVSALAEWTWNLEGRGLEQLAKAWAARAGYAQPEKVAEWVGLMAPVEQPLHYVLTTRNWNKLPDAMKAGEALGPGRGILAGFPNTQTLDAQLAACERGQALAKQAAARDLALETDYAAAFVRSLKALNALVDRGARAQQAAALAALGQGARDMIKAFDARMDLVKAEPKDFAVSIKKLHAEMWEQRVNAVSAAVRR